MEENLDSYNEDEDDYTASLNRFEKMLTNNEHYFFDVEEFEDLINHYLDSNELEKAKQVIEISLEQHPSSSILKIKHAEYLASTHKPNKALEILNSIETLEPFNSDNYLLKANIYSQIRQHNKAIETLYKALKIIHERSEKASILIHIAFEYENLNRYDKAISILKEILAENPDNETVLYEI
ncbi:MAG: hypothetical protein GW818_05300, partial [Flavobacteriales bacterium]|nr:hypothetical protein [Flavobacteriales bacterium]